DPNAPYAMAGGAAFDGSRMILSADQYAVGGKLFPFRWEATETEPEAARLPVSREFTETVKAGGMAFDPEEGRVFLIDLTATPPAVSQHKADLDELFKGIGDDVAKADLENIVERLSEWEPAVKDFLARLPKRP
ncbi:MAG: hypothetical protein K2W96_07030, partial [Gemmataceae bacterium]|nr:hypothetical protein [Gemmataceae bacterium]